MTTVELLDGDRCARFTSTVVSGVEVGPSARWMASRLTAAGMRPINNVVDVSNYVMLELGQPNHAYDLATLGGHGFRVRLAHEGEQLTTLDGVARTLSAADLLICDAEDRPIGLAGIMGGADTEISPTTTDVALEMAWFEPTGIAQTVARTGLRSEASARFERGVDPYVIDRAIARFVELLAETCPDVVVRRNAVDARSEDLPPAARATKVRVSEVARILGPAIPGDEIVALLEPIGFSATPAGDGVLEVDIPSWRPDSAAEIDVIEEVGRLYGYDRIGKRMPSSTIHGRLSSVQKRRRELRQVLLGLGISEAMPNPFLAPDALARVPVSTATCCASPIRSSPTRACCGPHCVPVCSRPSPSTSRTAGPVWRCSRSATSTRPGRASCPPSTRRSASCWRGPRRPPRSPCGGRWPRRWASAPGSTRAACHRACTRRARPRSSPGRDAIGAVGEVAPEVLAAFEIDERVAVLELDLRARARARARARRSGSRRAATRRAIWTWRSCSVTTCPPNGWTRPSARAPARLLVGLELFDVYRGERLGKGRRSLAFRLRLQAPDRNLTDADVATVREKVAAAAGKLGAHLRA